MVQVVEIQTNGDAGDKFTQSHRSLQSLTRRSDRLEERFERPTPEIGLIIMGYVRREV